MGPPPCRNNSCMLTAAWSSMQVFYFHNFLTNEERVHLIETALPYVREWDAVALPVRGPTTSLCARVQMKRSTVVGAGGASVVDNVRTSYGAFLRRLSDPIVANIEKRISMWTHVPIEHQEDIQVKYRRRGKSFDPLFRPPPLAQSTECASQVLRYEEGQTYRAHYDSSYDKAEKGPKFRLCTFLMYLSGANPPSPSSPRDPPSRLRACVAQTWSRAARQPSLRSRCTLTPRSRPRGGRGRTAPGATSLPSQGRATLSSSTRTSL